MTTFEVDDPGQEMPVFPIIPTGAALAAPCPLCSEDPAEFLAFDFDAQVGINSLISG